VISFSPFSLHEIDWHKKGQTALQLKFIYTRDDWSGRANDIDISDKIDRRVVQTLASTLGSLTASDWITTSQVAYKALDEPLLTIKILIEEIDPALQESRKVSHSLKFAPASAGFYYGSLDNSPDVFILNRETFSKIFQPVLASPTALSPVQ